MAEQNKTYLWLSVAHLTTDVAGDEQWNAKAFKNQEDAESYSSELNRFLFNAGKEGREDGDFLLEFKKKYNQDIPLGRFEQREFEEDRFCTAFYYKAEAVELITL